MSNFRHSKCSTGNWQQKLAASWQPCAMSVSTMATAHIKPTEFLISTVSLTTRSPEIFLPVNKFSFKVAKWRLCQS